MKRNRRGGFSLIELMVVVAIMGLLATVVAVSLTEHMKHARLTKVASDLDAIEKGVELFKLTTGRYPHRFEELWTAPSGGRKWSGPYLDHVPPAPRDPWGNEYVYTPPVSGKYVVTSYGADGAPGGADEAQDLTTDNIRGIVEGS